MKREILQAVAYAISQERSLELVLKCIVEGLVRSGGIALARVLISPNRWGFVPALPGIP
ncbi:MAG: hypothetical protein ABSG46_00305 [Candidatus Binataceae bacterium]